MAALRVILVSDTHLSPVAPEATANWDAVLRYVGDAAPDVVIHLGDLTQAGAHDPAELEYGRRQLDRLPVTWYAVPGNHDVGDNPWPGAPADITIDDVRYQRWLDIVGADHWSLTVSGWTMLAINAQLLGSGLDAEAWQWSWLQERIAERDPSDRVALIAHKPIAAADPELAAAPAYRFWLPAARARLRGVFDGTPAALVMSGHVHQYRQLDLDGSHHLWAPTTWAVLPDQVQPVLGAKRCGIVSLEFEAGKLPEPTLVEPPGIAQLTIGSDIPDPNQR